MNSNRVLNSLISKQLSERKLTKQIPITEISVGEKIDQGNMGVIYHGMWNKQKIAIKKLRPDRLDKQKNIDAFKAEIAIMEMTSEKLHSNILTYFGYSILANQLVILIEYMQVDLEKYIYEKDEKDKFDYQQCYSIILGVVSGVSALHGIGIVHLDLKPGNILLDDKLTPKLADFGSARLLKANETLEVDLGSLGSPYHSPPEAQTDPAFFEQKSDVFNLAITMWELINWQLAQYMPKGTLIPGKNIKPYQEMLDNTQSSLAPLIKKCWAERTNDRLSIKEVAEELKNYVPKNANLKL